MRIPLLACLVALVGCVTAPSPKFTYNQIEAIVPGVTTKAEVLKTFGEPRRFSGRVAESVGDVPHIQTFSYEERSGYRVQTVNIAFTNGIVSMVWSSVSDIDPLVW